MPEPQERASKQSIRSLADKSCTLGSSLGATSGCPTSQTSVDPEVEMGSDNTAAAHDSSLTAEPDTDNIHGINQVVLIIQPDDSTQYMLLSEEGALREAAAKQAAAEAEHQGLVPVDPRDAAIMQAIEDGDAAVRRVFQQRLQASLQRSSQCLIDLHPPHSDRERSQGDRLDGSGEETWLAQLQAADMALTAQLNSRDAALSARI